MHKKFEREAQWIIKKLSLLWPHRSVVVEKANVHCQHILHAMVVEHMDVPYIICYQQHLVTQFFDPAQLWNIQDLHCQWVDLMDMRTRAEKALYKLESSAKKGNTTLLSSTLSSPLIESENHVSKMILSGQYPYQDLPYDQCEIQAFLTFAKLFAGLASRKEALAELATAVAEQKAVGQGKRKFISKRTRVDTLHSLLAGCQASGILGLQRHLGILPAHVANNYNAAAYEASEHLVKNPPEGIDDVIVKLQVSLRQANNKQSDMTTKDGGNQNSLSAPTVIDHRVADSATLMRSFERCAAISLAFEPQLRQLILRDLKNRATIDTDPTKRGKEEICEDPFHELFGIHRLRSKPVDECLFQAPSFETPRNFQNHRDNYQSTIRPQASDPYDTPAPSSIATVGQRPDRNKRSEHRWDTAFRGTTFARIKYGVNKGFLKMNIDLHGLKKATTKLRRSFLTPDHFDKMISGAPLTQESLISGWDELRERVIQRALREYLIPAAKTQLRQELQKAANISIATHCASSLRDLVRFQPWRRGQPSNVDLATLTGMTTTIHNPLNGNMIGGELWVPDDDGC
jgi:transcriptional accessory protein Tex/SPT6